MKNKAYCAECNKKHPDYHPIEYTIGRCDDCGGYLGVARVEYRPQVIDELFGDLKPVDNF